MHLIGVDDNTRRLLAANDDVQTRYDVSTNVESRYNVSPNVRTRNDVSTNVESSYDVLSNVARREKYLDVTTDKETNRSDEIKSERTNSNDRFCQTAKQESKDEESPGKNSSVAQKIVGFKNSINLTYTSPIIGEG